MMKWRWIMGSVSLILLTLSCTIREQPSESVEALIEILQTPESAAFVDATARLAQMEPSQIVSASLTLAKAMQYPRRDSDAAAAVLIDLGPLAKEAIPEVINALANERPEVRADAAIILGVMGEVAQCAVPRLAPLLWDEAPEVRGSAARALDAITGVNLVKSWYKLERLEMSSRIIYDDDLGTLSKKAQSWWTFAGQDQSWQDGDPCQALD